MARAKAQTSRTAPARKTVAEIPATPPVQPDPVLEPIAPEPPLVQTPGEGAQLDGGLIAAPGKTPITERIVPGDGLDQAIQLSPIAIDGGAQTDVGTEVVTVPEGDPSAVRDVIEVPSWGIHPDDDENRPRGAVLVSDRSQWAQTGAWMTHPRNPSKVLLTFDIQRVSYSEASPKPNYLMVGRRASEMIHPPR